MNFIQKLIRRRAIKKIEKDIAAEYSKSIQEFLSKPVIAQLDAHFTRQNEIEQKLENNRRDRNKLANSKLWEFRNTIHGHFYLVCTRFWHGTIEENVIGWKTRLGNADNCIQEKSSCKIGGTD